MTRVYVLSVEGEVGPSMEAFIDRAIDQAIRGDADVIVLSLDTPGGSVGSLKEIVARIEEAEDEGIRTVAYVLDWGASAGVIMAISCRDVYVRSEATIGAAAPLDAATGEASGEKVVSFFREYAKGRAEKHGRPGNLAKAMVDKDTEVWQVVVNEPDGEKRYYLTPDEIRELFGILGERHHEVEEVKGEDGKIIEVPRVRQSYDQITYTVEGKTVTIAKQINAPGKILTLSAREAVEYGMADGIAENRDELYEKLGISKPREVVLGPTWAEGIVAFLNHPIVAGLLLTIFSACVLIEIYHAPGLGVALVGLAALALFFTSHFVVGTASVLDIALVAIGIVLLMVEIFTPGFGVIGVSGIVLVLLGLVLAFQDFSVPEDSTDWTAVVGNLFRVTVSLAFGVILIGISLRYIPQTGALNRLVSSATMPPSEGYKVARPDEAELLGRTGRVANRLRPAGKVEIGDRLVDVVSRGEWIDVGVEVKVVAIEGPRIVVERIRPPDERA
ncbi:MAG: hypothetical protein HY720_16320 [Planctomycetes bacterium]|nr:hypothetical protein [Planctomycetota bacterium]